MSEKGEKRIIEINGVKLEVDLSTAKRVDEFRVGDPVKVLIKEYNDQYKVYSGVIVGFENFKNRPTITVAYLKVSYDTAEIEFLYYHENCNSEICHTSYQELPINRSAVLEKLNSEMDKKYEDIRQLKLKKQFFISNFGKYFSEIECSDFGGEDV